MEVDVRRTDELDAAMLAEVRELLDDAFADDPLTEDDWEHCLGGLHVVVHQSGTLLAHAAVVPRELVVDGTTVRAGYVEGVGVRRARRRRGLGGMVMGPVEALAGGEFEALALASSDEGLPFYAARGWRRWPGRTYVMTRAGRRRTPEEDESVMVWPSGPFADVGPDSELTCHERRGDDW